MSANAPVFDAVRPWLDGKGFTADRIAVLNAACAKLRGEAPPPAPKTQLTARIAIELIAHEGIVREAYKDSKGIWTWSVGLATTGGWPVMQYKDNPASLEVCLAAYCDALRKKYLREVLAEFPEPLAEHQLGALLSFHYNTGAIGRLKANAMDFMQWRRPAEIVGRRRSEAALFRDGTWTGNGTAMVYDVAKPSYAPVRPKRVEVAAILERLLA